MHWQLRGRANATHEIRSFLRGVWLTPMLLLGAMPVTWASVYECKNPSGGITFTDSPSQLEQCRVIKTAPASLAKKPDYPGSPPPADSNTSSTQFAPGLTTTPAPDPAFTSSDPPETSAPQPSAVPLAAPAPGIAINPIHPFFLPQGAISPAGTEQKP